MIREDSLALPLAVVRALDGTDRATHQVQASMIRRHII